MNPDKNFERRKVLTELLGKTPFQFQFMSINDDIELTPTAIANNHDSKRAIDALGRDLTRGELASTFNHMLCFKKFLNSNNKKLLVATSFNMNLRKCYANRNLIEFSIGNYVGSERGILIDTHVLN